MSMFTSRDGLYARARKQFKIQDGIRLFTYSFFKQRRAEVQAFFAQIYSEAQASRAAPGHHALAAIAEMGRIKRHYTLNIDGLAEVVGMSTWHHELHPTGSTVEMHGNIRQLVCPACFSVEPLTRQAINTMKEQKAIQCPSCAADELRFKVMLYDDDQGDCITPEHVFETLEEDLQVADCVLWVGISFEQSASVEYFRRVRQVLASQGRLAACPQAIINPAEEACFNIVSSVCNVDDLQLLDVRTT
ncbi:deacetylase sirtuin-type domain-containing protein, partial [Haematococcus lacustris]